MQKHRLQIIFPDISFNPSFMRRYEFDHKVAFVIKKLCKREIRVHDGVCSKCISHSFKFVFISWCTDCTQSVSE